MSNVARGVLKFGIKASCVGSRRWAGASRGRLSVCRLVSSLQWPDAGCRPQNGQLATGGLPVSRDRRLGWKRLSNVEAARGSYLRSRICPLRTEQGPAVKSAKSMTQRHSLAAAVPRCGRNSESERYPIARVRCGNGRPRAGIIR